MLHQCGAKKKKSYKIIKEVYFNCEITPSTLIYKHSDFTSPYDFALLPVCSVVVFMRLSSSVKKQLLFSPLTSPAPISQVSTMMGPLSPFRWTWMQSCVNTNTKTHTQPKSIWWNFYSVYLLNASATGMYYLHEIKSVLSTYYIIFNFYCLISIHIN